MYKKINKKALHTLKMQKLANKNGWIVAIPVACILLVSVFFNIYTPIKKNKQYNDTVNEYECKIQNLNDSLQFELDYAKTLSEKCHIYTEIGKVSVERDKYHILTEDSIWAYIKSLGVWFPEYIMAQAVIESQCGKVTPNKSNNLFGMTIPQRRETTALAPSNKNDVYAKYKNWKMSVIDRVLWELDAFKNIKPTEEAYLKRISSYAQSPTYLEKVKSTAKSYKNKK
jgi:hypothetical protein